MIILKELQQIFYKLRLGNVNSYVNLCTSSRHRNKYNRDFLKYIHRMTYSFSQRSDSEGTEWGIVISLKVSNLHVAS